MYYVFILEQELYIIDIKIVLLLLDKKNNIVYHKHILYLLIITYPTLKDSCCLLGVTNKVHVVKRIVSLSTKQLWGASLCMFGLYLSVS